MSVEREDNVGKIIIGIRQKIVNGGRVSVRVAASMESTTMPGFTTELERIMHTLSKTSFAEATDTTMGFPYAFPLIFGT